MGQVHVLHYGALVAFNIERYCDNKQSANLPDSRHLSLSSTT
jgi:hypothetical protein